MNKTFESAAVVELPPPPPAHVVMWEGRSARYRCEEIGCWVAPPEEPPYDGEHAHEGRRDPLRINVSDTLNGRRRPTSRSPTSWRRDPCHNFDR